MKCVRADRLETFIRSMSSTYDVHVPIRLHDGTRSLGGLDEGPLALTGEMILQKVTKVFFPPLEVMTELTSRAQESPKQPIRPMLVIGFTAADVACLAFIDRFYQENFRDDLYFAKRDAALVVCISGRCGHAGGFMRIAGGQCDMELVSCGQDYIALGYTEPGQDLVERMPDAGGDAETLFRELKQESESLSGADEALLRQASSLLLEDKVPVSFWQGVADRCITCTSCNLVCPTCTCFDVFDRQAEGGMERWRIWDSCLLDGFMREASGHNPMGQEWQRSCRRIHHKLGADVRRWGRIGCMLCGRCDRVCPTGIGIKAVCREIVEAYGHA